jgi:hypothetical protein
VVPQRRQGNMAPLNYPHKKKLGML